MDKLPIYKMVIDENDDYSGVNFVSLVDEPAIMMNWQVFNSVKQTFKIDNDKRIISGAMMVADLPIYRRDDKMGEYYVVFDKPTIESIQRKFMANGFTKNFNLMHDSNFQTTTAVMFNSFIVDKSLGIETPKGYDELPDGSWFGSVYIADEELWKLVKSGKFRGFSVEGYFDLVYQNDKKEKDIIKEIQTILTD